MTKYLFLPYFLKIKCKSELFLMVMSFALFFQILKYGFTYLLNNSFYISIAAVSKVNNKKILKFFFKYDYLIYLFCFLASENKSLVSSILFDIVIIFCCLINN